MRRTNLKNLSQCCKSVYSKEMVWWSRFFVPEGFHGKSESTIKITTERIRMPQLARDKRGKLVIGNSETVIFWDRWFSKLGIRIRFQLPILMHRTSVSAQLRTYKKFSKKFTFSN